MMGVGRRAMIITVCVSFVLTVVGIVYAFIYGGIGGAIGACISVLGILTLPDSNKT